MKSKQNLTNIIGAATLTALVLATFLIFRPGNGTAMSAANLGGEASMMEDEGEGFSLFGFGEGEEGEEMEEDEMEEGTPEGEGMTGDENEEPEEDENEGLFGLGGDDDDDDDESEEDDD